ncbi:glycosyltransferase [Salinivibrio sp. YCSC6]|uniref:glycosyltransferase n=1 Tax=Salinivibrio sp. YCSC6 TaxID=2003370 RepID=UPI000BBCBF0C|nr:glycosyltransferase [Salinivibrio sp. YCSC6]PCE67627.1 hypothetical protein B6G00_04585 [Salinivibrio sp. YCSC6]QCF35472.1 glycosyltransferase [Salinivibrio sp. YCSC6]
MNIVYIITGLGMGGAEQQVCSLADYQDYLGNNVTLISLGSCGKIKPKRESIVVEEIGMKKSPMGFLKALLYTAKILKVRDVDLIHSHMFHANIFSRVLKLMFLKVPLICTSHTTNEGSWWRMLVYRLTDCVCDMNTSVSIDAASCAVNRGAVPKHKIKVMYNGIDTCRFYHDSSSRIYYRNLLSVSQNTKVFLAVGRMTHAKDYPNMLQAFKLVADYRHDIHLVIIGDGDELEGIKCLTKQLSLDDKVTFLGARTDITEWMNASDYFLLSSAWEGFGLVVAEAMACEKVVIATDCGGVGEVAGNNNYLCRPNDSKALANNILKALSLSESSYKKIGMLNREKVSDKYSMKVISGKWSKLYSCLAEGRK